MSLKFPIHEQRTVIEDRHTFVDSDLLLYISRDPNEPVEHVLHSVKLTLQQIQNETQCEHLRCFLSSETNFRYDIFPEYKANRKDLQKPPHYQETKDYLIKNWNAEVAPDGWEADDYIAWLCIGDGADPDKMVIGSIDKDFLTVPGWHYKWRTHGSGFVYWVTEDDAKAFLAYQLLVGDTADGIKSPVKPTLKSGKLAKSGFGSVKARDFLLQCTYDEMLFAVRCLYVWQGFEKEFDVNMKLLAIGKFV